MYNTHVKEDVEDQDEEVEEKDAHVRVSHTLFS
jgi:hypothetical protein